MNHRLRGLVAATHTPFRDDGQLNLAAVERQAEHLVQQGVDCAFVAGSTGECMSLTVDERMQLTQRWIEVTRGTNLPVIVHVGANCLADAKQLASQAQSLGAAAIAAFPPSYFKPKSVEALVACCQELAAAAPATPFYYYDIPALTGVSLPMPQFLERAANVIPTLVGIKFSNADLMAFQMCLQRENARFDIAWGIDEYMLAALALGAVGAVGSSYNFAAPVYRRLMAAFAEGDLDKARCEQYRSVQLIGVLARFGYMESAKQLMEWLQVPVGKARLPHSKLTDDRQRELRAEVEKLGFFEWVG